MRCSCTPCKRRGAPALHIQALLYKCIQNSNARTTAIEKQIPIKHMTSLFYTTLINLNMLCLHMYSGMLVKLAPARLVDSYDWRWRTPVTAGAAATSGRSHGRPDEHCTSINKCYSSLTRTSLAQKSSSSNNNRYSFATTTTSRRHNNTLFFCRRDVRKTRYILKRHTQASSTPTRAHKHVEKLHFVLAHLAGPTFNLDFEKILVTNVYFFWQLQWHF